MTSRFPQPYRGQSRPEYPDPRRQVRNLRAEKIRDAGTVLVFVILSVAALIIALVNLKDGGAMLLFVVLLGVFLSLAMADATRSVNKFRKGYDVDISGPQPARRSDDRKKTG